jgi:hypothetical protein
MTRLVAAGSRPDNDPAAEGFDLLIGASFESLI